AGAGRGTRRLLLDGEALALGEGGDPGLPLVERGDGVGLVGEGLADGLFEVRLHPVEERRPLERGVDGAADPGEDLVDLLAAVEGGGVTDVGGVGEQRLRRREKNCLVANSLALSGSLLMNWANTAAA